MKTFSTTFICVAGEIADIQMADFNANCANVCCWSKNGITMFRTNKANITSFLLSEIMEYIQDVKVLECVDGVLPVDGAINSINWGLWN